MADDVTKKPNAPAPSVPPKVATTGATPAGRAGGPTPRYMPQDDIPTSNEWAQQGGPPSATEPLTGWPSKRIDIFPRPPLDPANYLNLNSAGYGEMLPGLPGMIADKGANDKISRVPETDIPFGALVAIGDTGDGYCKVAGTGDVAKILGIAMRDTTSVGCVISTVGASAGVSTEVFPKDTWCVPIVKRGRVWAIPTTAVHEGDGVGVGANGALNSAASGGVSGAKWVTSAPANMLAQVELNLP